MNTYSIIGSVITSIPLVLIISILVIRGKKILEQ
jgi:hypothetical protein